MHQAEEINPRTAVKAAQASRVEIVLPRAVVILQAMPAMAVLWVNRKVKTVKPLPEQIRIRVVLVFNVPNKLAEVLLPLICYY
jgi:hypothetical protein